MDRLGYKQKQPKKCKEKSIKEKHSRGISKREIVNFGYNVLVFEKIEIVSGKKLDMRMPLLGPTHPPESGVLKQGMPGDPKHSTVFPKYCVFIKEPKRLERYPLDSKWVLRYPPTPQHNMGGEPKKMRSVRPYG